MSGRRFNAPYWDAAEVRFLLKAPLAFFLAVTVLFFSGCATTAFTLDPAAELKSYGKKLCLVQADYDPRKIMPIAVKRPQGAEFEVREIRSKKDLLF